MTHTYEQVASEPSGTIATDVTLHPEHHYDIHASTVTGDPPQPPSASQFAEIGPIAVEPATPFAQRLVQFSGRLIARLRRDA